MAGKGIDHSTCPKARVRGSLWSEAERAFAGVLRKALRDKVRVFVKVRVLDVIELVEEADKRRMFFWRDVLGDKHFDYVVCAKETLEPLIAVEMDDPKVRKRSSVEEDVKATVARQAGFPVVRFLAGVKLTAEVVRGKLVAEYRLARVGQLPGEEG